MEPRHQRALDAAVASAHDEFGDDLAGVLLTGSVARGDADEHSDLDVYVLVDRPWRQRRTRWIDGVEVELFVNPVSRIDDSLTGDVDQHAANMFATGTALYDRDGDLERLMHMARGVLGAEVQEPAPYALLMARYRPVDLLKDTRDVAADGPAFELMLATTVQVALESHYAIARRWWPKQKRVLRELAGWDPAAAALARAALDSAATQDARLAALTDLIDHVLAPVGGPLHEWESDREPINPDGTLA